MKLSDIGEFQLIEKIQSIFAVHQASGVVGIGDDCAVIPRELLEREILVTTDLLIEDVHFNRAQTSPEDLGYKSMAVNLSDIAAMGGKPQFAFLSLGLPQDLDFSWVDGFLKGFRSLAMDHSVALLGGDTTSSEKIMLNVVIIGSEARRSIKKRSDALNGDLVVVTGFLGDSAGGLKLLLESQWSAKIESGSPEIKKAAHKLIEAHRRPRPHVNEGLWLGRQSEVHAMMDVSDGIASDLQRIVDRSRCSIRVNVDEIPLSPELKLIGNYLGWQVIDLAIGGGEDYVLLSSVEEEKVPRLLDGFRDEFNQSLFVIGSVHENQAQGVSYFKQDQPFSPQKLGFDHFKK